MKYFIPFVFLSILFGATQGLGAEGKGQVAPKIALPVEVAGWKWDGKESTYNSRTVTGTWNPTTRTCSSLSCHGSETW